MNLQGAYAQVYEICVRAITAATIFTTYHLLLIKLLCFSYIFVEFLDWILQLYAHQFICTHLFTILREYLCIYLSFKFPVLSTLSDNR